MNDDATYAEIGRRQAEARKLLGLTQAEMADRIGVPMRTLSDNERGISVAGGRVLAAYCTLGIRSDWLLTGQGKPFSNETPQHIQDMIEVADNGQIALAHFKTSDIRKSYLVASDERRHLSRVSLSQELCADFCGTTDLGLPDSLPLFTIEDQQGGLLIVDGGTKAIQADGRYVIVHDGVLAERQIQVLESGQLALMTLGTSVRVEAVKLRDEVIVIGRIMGSISVL